jgi:hypothetical protein
MVKQKETLSGAWLGNKTSRFSIAKAALFLISPPTAKFP